MAIDMEIKDDYEVCEIVYLTCPKCKVGPIYAKIELEMFGTILPCCCRCNKYRLRDRRAEHFKDFDKR
jgi:hypothetical protein